MSFELPELVNRSGIKKARHIPFEFTERHRALFNQLREAMRRSLPLHEVNFGKPFYCFLDASKRSIPFIAFQVEVDDKDWFDKSKMDDSQRTKRIAEAVLFPSGTEKIVFCFSRKLTKSRGITLSSKLS